MDIKSIANVSEKYIKYCTNIGRKFKEVRNSLGLTQMEVSVEVSRKLVGDEYGRRMSILTISRIENGDICRDPFYRKNLVEYYEEVEKKVKSKPIVIEKRLNKN